MQRFTLTYSEPMVRDAVRTFVWRRGFVQQKPLWLAWLVLLALFILIATTGGRDWLFLLTGIATVVPPLFIALLWLAHFRNTVGRFRAMQPPVADLSLDDTGLGLASPLGTVHLPWPGFTEIWERQSYWMIFTAPNQFMTLPLETLTPEALDLLKANIPRFMASAPLPRTAHRQSNPPK